MKVILTIALAASIVVACNAQPKAGEAKPVNKVDSISYAIGLNIGENVKQQKLDINPDMLAAAIKDVQAGKQLMTKEQAQGVMMAMQQEQMKKMEEERAASGASAKAAGEKFLAENKSKQGVITTASGLQYKVITMGKGAKPAATDKVKVHYKGTLLNGKVFDSSYDRGQPIEFALNGVIKGWTEGVGLMPVGSKFTFYIPSEMAYGAQGAGQDIGPNETLIFDVELLDIVK